MSDRGEFSLIDTYFASPAVTRADVSLGTGDDCALLDVPAGKQLAVTMDTLVADRHFFPDTDPWRLGWKVLAVNLSDLAAMGAEPAWVTFAVTLPYVDESWLDTFMQGFSTLAMEHDVQLVGGDTTKGPLSVTLQAQGFVEPGRAMLRSGAKPGDGIYVTGDIGGAAVALKLLQAGAVVPAVLRDRLEQPVPRVRQGQKLASVASACIDISDGLAGDLRHILEASNCGARIGLDALPLLPETREYIADSDRQLPLTGGDDYELLFTVAEHDRAALESLLPELGCPVTRIGTIEQEPCLRLADRDGTLIEPGEAYDHFRHED
jgi:thiamine-monophosphate kinase